MRFELVIASALALLGCVNDGNPSGPKQGDVGGPCYANNTCNPGLVCALVNGAGVCEQPDGSVADTSEDPVTTDAPAEASGEAGSDAPDDGTCTAFAQKPCPGYDCIGMQCCADSNACSASCTNGDGFGCQKSSQCGSGLCCIAIQIQVASSCPPFASAANSACSSGASCANGEYQLCTSSTDCSGGTPTCAPVVISGMSTAIGVCM